MTIHKEKIPRKNIKLFQLLNDQEFWFKFTNVSLSPYRIKILREYRTKYLVPSKKLLKWFIEDDYKYITKDDRETKEIILDLLSE